MGVLSLQARFVLFVASILVVATPGSAQSLSFLYNGDCPNLTLTDNFNMQEFQGRWYEIKATEGNPYINSEQCTYSDFTALDSSMYVAGSGIGKRDKPVYKNLTLIQDGKTARFTVTLPSTGPRKKSLVSEFVVMGSDYKTYACIFACSKFDADYSARFAWVYSKFSEPTNDPVTLCGPALKQVGQDPTSRTWKSTPQGGACTYV